MTFSRHKLPNGLRLIFAPLYATDAVTALLFVKVGSRYETAGINGVSHFLEHMMFKGTDKRPTAQDVAKELDRIGADFNAFTSKDATAYYVKADKRHIGTALDVLADMMWHSRFLPEEIERERGVIIEEIHMYQDNPSMYLEDIFEEVVFGAHHPLGRHVIGPKKVIAGMKRETVVSYFEQHYTPSNMVLCVAGNFSENTVRKQIEKLFGSARRKKSASGFRPFQKHQRRPAAVVQHRTTQQAHVGFGFPALEHEHQDLPALSLLSVILGGNMSSRLFRKVREREGLCYHISASRHSYADTGVFLIRSGLDANRLLPALRLIVEELQSVKKDGVTEEELANAKEFIRGKLTLKLEDSEEVAHFLAQQEVFRKRVTTPEARLKEVERVRAAGVQDVARRILRRERANFALIGPFKKPQPFLRVLSSL